MSGETRADVTVRRARLEDHDAVTAFTEDTWSDREATDYVPRVFPEWVESDGPRQRTVVAEADDTLVGICQAVLLSPYEAWAQGMRVAPDYRGQGIVHALNDDLFAWARERGATVCRNMVFSWNVAGLGASRAAGFDPGVEFRWLYPDPDPDAVVPDSGLTVQTDRPDAAWSFWGRSDARDALAGLGLDMDESWALSAVTREQLHRAAEESSVLTVQGDRTRAFTYHVRDHERENEDGDTERWTEYGVAAWTDLDALRTLRAGIARDAAARDVDYARVLIPETPRHVSDAAYAGVELGEDPDFVMEADLTGE